MREVEQQRRPRLSRERPADPSNAPKMRLTDLDVQLMVEIWKREGVMTLEQMAAVRGVALKTLKKQLTRLYHNRYVGRVDATNRDRALRTGVYWLITKGALMVAAAFGKEDLTDFAYRKEPKWQTLNHDLKLNDIRIRVEQDVAQLHGAVLHEWVSDYEFHQLPDVVKVKQLLGRGDRGAVQRDREIMPDGYFSFSIPLSPGSEPRRRYRYLLELDLATETRKGQFGKDKVIPLTTYLDSEVYAQRFGAAGRVLVVTTTPARLKNLRAQAVEYNDKGYFLFTTLNEIDAAANMLVTPIWVSTHDEQPRALLSG